MSNYSSVDEGMDVGSGVSDQIGCTSMILAIVTIPTLLATSIFII